MRTLLRFGDVIFSVVSGGAVGGWIGCSLGDFGGRADSENVWFLSVIIGAAVGLAAVSALIFRGAGRLGWGYSLLLGSIYAIVSATAFILFTLFDHPFPPK